MNTIQRAIESAIDAVGSQQLIAEAIGVKQPTVSEWKTGARPIPIERCVDIERVTNARVRRWDLRPDDWHRIWPELIGNPGAPTPAVRSEPEPRHA